MQIQGGNQIKRGAGSFMHIVGWVMIFLFTGTCTVLLLRQYAPIDAPWLPWMGLAAFEFGVLHWLHYHRHNAKNALQFIIGLIMTAISACAIAACTAMEMMIWFTKSGVVALPGWVESAILYSIIGVIVLNVVAFILCSLFSPEHFTTWLQHSHAAYHTDARDMQIQIIDAPSTPPPALSVHKDTGDLATPGANTKKNKLPPLKLP